MSAVVRVKRRIDEVPLGALVLNCKRRRIDNEEVRENLFEARDEVSTILKFAGTVENQDENVATQITRLTKDEAKQLAQKSRKPNIAERSRQEMRENIQENRFRVVNCYRTVNNDEEAPQEITVVDIEKQGSNAATSSEQENAQDQGGSSEQVNAEYVYDYYLPENDQQTSEVNYVDTYLSVRPFDDLIYEDRFGDDDSAEDSEDSNREDYFKNDYPDTEEESSINESDMRQAVEDLDIDGERELSSEDDEREYNDSYVHTIDPDEEQLDDEVGYGRSCGSKGQRKKDRDYDDYDSELDDDDDYYSSD